jgi:uncharacterized protein YkwD
MGRQAVAPVQLAVAAASLVLAPGVRASSGSVCPDANLRPTAANLVRVETAMVCLLNVERTRVGHAPVTRNRRLDRSSARQTEDMTTRGYFAHERRGGPSLLERITDAGYFTGARSGLYSENLGYAPPERARAARMTAAFAYSESHRKTMLYGRFRNVGVNAAYIDPNPAFYADYPAVVFTLDFGRRYERRRRCRRAGAGVDEGSGGRATPPRRWCRRRRAQ